MTDEPRLSEHGHRLMWRLLEDDGDGVALTVIPSSALAMYTGQSIGDWMAERAAILRSVGQAVEELRALGWNLHVATRTGAELDHPGLDRIIAVEWLHCDGHAPDGLPLADELLPGRQRPPRTGEAEAA
jgi:hypothetical protein